ncbi:uncharacterized protein LOC134820731 isoform X2 [Bolinopsis microptera]|uniref:uncharacterized protein LOC134820731 isoform X2 n=1 Tax=Bolinopsis microptera TaxID=2820187 RepID=UPI00307943CD
MRFAPPKSAPPEARKFSKDVERELQEDYNISGWVIKPVQPDITLLRECLNTAPRRCSSATERTSCGQLIVNFGRVSSSHLKLKCSLTEGSIKNRTRSKDSGVDGLTDSGVDNMIDSKTRPFEEDEDEFSDISESNDGSMDNEQDSELARLMVSEPELSEQDSGGDTMQHELDSAPSEEQTKLSQSELASSLKSYVERSSVLSRNKRRAKGDVEKVEREHQLPNPVTPDIPEVTVPPKQQLWSRSRKLERHSTSPSICSYNEVCAQLYDGKKSPDQFLNSTFDNVLPNNRPPYRNDKRRSSNCSFKSSCSIPSFSTPNQALLLIGMKPSSKPQQELNKNNLGRPPIRKPGMQKPPIMNKTRGLVSNKNHHVLQLPELGVNGSGDLVIRKKQIISG